MACAYRFFLRDMEICHFSLSQRLIWTLFVCSGDIPWIPSPKKIIESTSGCPSMWNKTRMVSLVSPPAILPDCSYSSEAARTDQFALPDPVGDPSSPVLTEK